MLAIEIEFLAGRSVATASHDRNTSEWPPHPVRLVYALVAATGELATEEERLALRWLCALPAPAIACSSAARRDIVTAYVPVNDRSPKKGSFAAGTLPRERQPRTFPSVAPEDPVVTFAWKADPGPHRDSLSSLVSRLVYLGHSSSLVRAALVEKPPPPTLVPAPGGRVRLRVPAEGLLEALESSFELGQRGIRGQLPAAWAAYAYANATPPALPPGSIFGDLVVLRRAAGPPLPLASAERAALALRAAILSLVSEPLLPEISGHANDGSPLSRPHVAFVALPDVGHRHASGRLLGVGVMLPESLDPQARSRLLDALGRLGTLALGNGLVWRLEPASHLSERPLPTGLRRETWTGPSARWATATPLELDRFVDDRLGPEAEAVVARSLSNVGLPEPARVRLTPVSALESGGHWRDIRRASRTSQRLLVHAIVDFEQPVGGPIAIGAGRYRGLGLLRPLQPR